MIGDPILRGPVRRPPGTDGSLVPLMLTVYGGLNYLRGNSAPYFSLTYWQHRSGHPNQCQSGGAGHELILQLYPELADLAALHLSDIDGAPTGAEANGWYWLAGALGGLGQRYHGGSLPSRSEAECLAIFARHCRISEGEAMTIRSAVLRAYASAGPEAVELEPAARQAAARAEWGAIMDAMRPRWKSEADAAIEKHGLVVYGDPWTPEQEEVRA